MISWRDLAKRHQMTQASAQAVLIVSWHTHTRLCQRPSDCGHVLSTKTQVTGFVDMDTVSRTRTSLMLEGLVLLSWSSSLQIQTNSNRETSQLDHVFTCCNISSHFCSASCHAQVFSLTPPILNGICSFSRRELLECQIAGKCNCTHKCTH